MSVRSHSVPCTAAVPISAGPEYQEDDREGKNATTFAEATNGTECLTTLWKTSLSYQPGFSIDPSVAIIVGKNLCEIKGIL